MKVSFRGFAENLLFAANIFIVFLLVLENEISVPYWLQPLGRMHPMVLHFPIVILMLAMLLEFFRFRQANLREKLYQHFTSSLLLAGALFSAVTVIMGLFLSMEESYAGELLQWHKWTGVSIVFLASLIYWFRNFSWYKVYVARAGAIVTAGCIIVAGHYGATLTHGENFVLESVSPPAEVPVVPLAEAKIFDHVIMSIFTQKCLGCHNIDKAKGGLMMDNLPNVLKGGKSGKLFVAGDPEISLLLERVHLPLEEKKHMPPKDKTQLTADEIALLHLWIKNNADVKNKVVDLPANDSLRLLATTYLTAEDFVEQYDFTAADESTIRKLNNNYRVISPIAKESPALAVSVYNKDSYNSKVLEELGPVRKQIVSLNLNGMPVTDKDLKIVAKFENLRTLDLNFSRISDAGLKQLLGLSRLEALSLSGTNVSYSAAKQIGRLNNLRQVSLWNTAVSEAEIRELQKAANGIVFISGFKDDGKHPVKLNQPRVKNDSSIFTRALSLQLTHPIKGVEIRYTTDGSEPDSVRSPVYDKGIVIKDNMTLKARAYKKGWYGSDVISCNFYKSTYSPDSILFLKPANEKYREGGPKVMVDRQLGGLDVNAGKWIGFRENSMEALLLFKQPVTMQSVTLNVLRQIPTYIFPPTSIQIWGGTDKNNLRLLSTTSLKVPAPDAADSFIRMESTFKPQQVSCIKIVANNLKRLPAWHPGKGEPAWVFVDEIFLN